MFNNNYKEIKNPTIGFYKEKGSKFISYLFPVYSEEDVKEKLVKIKKLEHAARHHCYAYIINSDKSEQRANDDGEPSSTAGKPILGQIQSNNLTNTLIIVARYFGGTKLGVPGLIRSYKKAASDAISSGIILKKTIKEEYKVDFKFPQINNVMRLIKENELEVVSTNFKTDCTLIFTVPKNKADNIVCKFKNNHKLKLKYLKTI
ncbi:MAG: YigZ family protein [Flavobacteriales bacterium]|nr:YigZ family protein [Flavobacteriales bacterium]|tara:strand:- start:13271 stop:13882 length:612 start_codon:yes stop_codon:yes gene_type:complete